MKIVAGLGNPGPEYDATRHNVGWWMADRLAYDWGFGPFSHEGRGLVSSGVVSGQAVTLVKPTTYMNRSGGAILPLLPAPEQFDPGLDLLVIVDDVALDVGRVRLRGGGSPGGHKGLVSVGQTLGTEDFARLRIGVGRPPAGGDLVGWVLSPLPPDEEEVVVGLLAQLTRGVEVWLEEGPERAMSVINR